MLEISISSCCRISNFIHIKHIAIGWTLIALVIINSIRESHNQSTGYEPMLDCGISVIIFTKRGQVSEGDG